MKQSRQMRHCRPRVPVAEFTRGYPVLGITFLTKRSGLEMCPRWGANSNPLFFQAGVPQPNRCRPDVRASIIRVAATRRPKTTTGARSDAAFGGPQGKANSQVCIGMASFCLDHAVSSVLRQ